jgi:hypothetical protein
MTPDDVEPTPATSGFAADAAHATEPARWLLEVAAGDGLPLTQTFALARVIVREAAVRWPDWWNTEVHGQPHREADLRLLEELHAGLRRLRLVRRRGRRLLATVRGRELVADAPELLRVLASDLGRGDAFTQSLAGAVVAALAVDEPRTYDQLTATAFPQLDAQGWQTGSGVRLTERDASWAVAEVINRGVAYGLFERRREGTESRFYANLVALTRVGAVALGLPMAGVTDISVLVFDAQVVSVRAEWVSGVRARLAVASYQHLTALHEAILAAFGLDDDHLYSFWLDGRFWGDREAEYTRPRTAETDAREADTPLVELDLAPGAKLAYVFDFGDEWRVALTVSASIEADGGPYPRVLRREGSPPPQYPPPPPSDDDDDDHDA